MNLYSIKKDGVSRAPEQPELIKRVLPGKHIWTNDSRWYPYCPESGEFVHMIQCDEWESEYLITTSDGQVKTFYKRAPTTRFTPSAFTFMFVGVMLSLIADAVIRYAYP